MGFRIKGFGFGWVIVGLRWLVRKEDSSLGYRSEVRDLAGVAALAGRWWMVVQGFTASV